MTWLRTVRKRAADVLAITTAAFAVTGIAGSLLVLTDALIKPFFGH